MSIRLEELHTALENNDAELFEKLLTPQNINFVDNERRRTLLMWSVALRKHHITEILLNFGASLYPRDMFQFNVIHYASWCADVKMMEILLFSFSSNIDHSSENVKLGTLHKIGSKFRNGAKSLVDLPHSSSGRTPLMFASMRGDVNMVNFLLTKAGADVNLKDFNGNTAMDLASHFGHKSVVTYLLSKSDDSADLEFDNTRRQAEDNCENAMTICQLEVQKELNILLCLNWLPQSLVALS